MKTWNSKLRIPCLPFTPPQETEKPRQTLPQLFPRAQAAALWHHTFPHRWKFSEKQRYSVNAILKYAEHTANSKTTSPGRCMFKSLQEFLLWCFPTASLHHCTKPVTLMGINSGKGQCFDKWCWDNASCACERWKLDPYLTLCNKN